MKTPTFWPDILLLYGWISFLIGLIGGGLLRRVRPPRPSFDDFVDPIRRKLRVARIFTAAFPITTIVYANSMRSLILPEIWLEVGALSMMVTTIGVPLLVASSALWKVRIFPLVFVPCVPGIVAVLIMIAGLVEHICA